MNKKPGLVFSVLLFTFVILGAAFNMNLDGRTSVKLRAGIDSANVLYICPIDNTTWTGISSSLHTLSRYASIAFLLFGSVLFFSWGWALYQNLLKDKFSADVYKNPWGLTKIFFWAGVIITVLAMTPNYFRTVNVNINGDETQWFLCENTSDGARPVNPKTVTLR